MAEFAYNNANNASIGHTPFELNCGYHPCVLFEEDVDLCSKSRSADKLSAELWELTLVFRDNLLRAQELQKRAHDKDVKPGSYVPSEKVWLNTKYIKTKRNRKLKAMFFWPFQVLHPVGKQAYKLKLLKRWRIYDVFYVSLLKQDTTRKGQVDENINPLDFETGDGEEYKVEAIWDTAVYAKELGSGQLPGLYYLISWKGYPKEKNTWEPSLAVQHLKKLIKSFHKEYSDKPIVTSPPIDTAPPMAKSTIKNAGRIKRKSGRQANRAQKQTKKS